MKFLIIFLSIIVLILYILGIIFYFKEDIEAHEKFTGFATALMFFLLFPSFLYYRYQHKLSKKNSDD